MKDNKKFTNVFTRNIFELAEISNVVTKETSQILQQTLTLTKTANKFSQSLRGFIPLMKDIISVKLKRLSIALIDIIVYFELVYC